MAPSNTHRLKMARKAVRRGEISLELKKIGRVQRLLGYAPHGGYAKYQPHQGEREIARRLARGE